MYMYFLLLNPARFDRALVVAGARKLFKLAPPSPNRQLSYDWVKAVLGIHIKKTC